MPRVDDRDVRYGLRHGMSFTPGGVFARIAGTTEIEVNSLHGQGIDRPAPGLALEGHAPAGPPEAVSVTGAKRLALCLQWPTERSAMRRAGKESVHTGRSRWSTCH